MTSDERLNEMLNERGIQTQLLMDAANTLNGLGPGLNLDGDRPRIVYDEALVKDIEKIMKQCYCDLMEALQLMDTIVEGGILPYEKESSLASTPYHL